jgi:HEAT repeat protein
MTGSTRKLGLVVSALCFAAPRALAQDVQGTFQQAVEQLQRDRKEEALALLRQVLAMDPTPEQAYALWQATDHATWLEILTSGGEFEQIAKHLNRLITSERRARRADEDAIRALIARLATEDPVARRAAVRELSANHGEYAVPYLLPALGDSSDDERRITAIQTLKEMSIDVVLPLIEALDTEDAFQRRNVAAALAGIGDRRALGALERVAESDPDGACQAVAREGVAAMGGGAGAARDLARLGEDYHMRKETVVAAHLASDVAWSWHGGRLVASPIPASLYADEIAKRCFQRALAADPESLDAQAGLARAHAGQVAAVEALAAAGQDASAMPQGDAGRIALALSGARALDAALSMSVSQSDIATATVLVRALADVAGRPTDAMFSGLRSHDGVLRAEAAVALGRMAARGCTNATAELVAALGEVAGREVMRIALVIDGDGPRADAMASALGAAGMHVTVADGGAKGLSLLHRVPGVDAVLVAESLPDLTAFQVIDDLRADPGYASTPIFVLAASAEQAGELFGEKVQGVLASADVQPVLASLDPALDADRAQADALAAHAASSLAALAAQGVDVRGTAAALASTLAHRGDSVAVPAAGALAASGGPGEVAPLSAVVADGSRSEAVRVACADALSALFARGVSGAEAAALLQGVVNSDAPISVRRAAAGALGNLAIGGVERAALLRSAGAGAQG